MIGKLLSQAVKIATCPVDVAEAVVDVMVGGDGSKASRQDNPVAPSHVRDAACRALEDIDDD